MSRQDKEMINYSTCNGNCDNCIDYDDDREPQMYCWICDWCKKSFAEDVAHPRQTFDGGTICHECFERDDEGQQIARYGIDQYDAENEGVAVRDVDGKVNYE